MSKIKTLRKFWKGKKVFITGHTGFKGSWMLILLNMIGAKIYGYSLKPNKKSLFIQAKCKDFLKGNFYADINDYNNLKKKISKTKPNILFHLAAQPLVSQSFVNPLETLKTNILGTANLLNIIRKIPSLKSVVIITTDKVYKIKKSNKQYSELDDLGGKDPYSVSKVCAEFLTNSYIESFFKNKKLRNSVSTARSGNVLGGGDYSKDRLLPDIISSINLNKKIIIRNPKNIRPWQHVIEPIYGYLRLAELQYKKKKLHQNQCWNFGPNKGSFVSVSYILKMINKNLKLKVKVKKNQKFFETAILKLDSKKSKKILNWKPKWNLQKSIHSVIDWNEKFKLNENAKKICENQIKDYFK